MARPDQPDILTREEVRDRIVDLTKKTGREMVRGPKWLARWLPSAYFSLMDVPVDKIQQPMRLKFPKLAARKAKNPEMLKKPIFIDRNRPELTGWHNQDVLCIDGKHRVQGARLAGVETIKAYVGVQALYHFMDPNSKGYDYKKGKL